MTRTFSVLRSEFSFLATTVNFARALLPMRTFSRSNDDLGFGLSAVVVAPVQEECSEPLLRSAAIAFARSPRNRCTHRVERTTCGCDRPSPFPPARGRDDTSAAKYFCRRALPATDSVGVIVCPFCRQPEAATQPSRLSFTFFSETRVGVNDVPLLRHEHPISESNLSLAGSTLRHHDQRYQKRSEARHGHDNHRLSSTPLPVGDGQFTWRISTRTS